MTSARRRTAAIVVLLAALLSSCGLPGSGNARTVADDDVPYRLLDPETSVSSSDDPAALAVTPLVFWVDGERLLPTSIGQRCSEPAEVVVQDLLDVLAAGPAADARTKGRSSVVPTDSRIELVGIEGGTATVDLQTDTSLSAEQLPVAVGQIVLTVTSAPSVESVVLTSDGEPIQVPLPRGPLTGEPVTGRDYAVLLPTRLRVGDLGCPGP